MFSLFRRPTFYILYRQTDAAQHLRRVYCIASNFSANSFSTFPYVFESMPPSQSRLFLDNAPFIIILIFNRDLWINTLQIYNEYNKNNNEAGKYCKQMVSARPKSHMKTSALNSFVLDYSAVVSSLSVPQKDRIGEMTEYGVCLNYRRRPWRRQRKRRRRRHSVQTLIAPLSS